MSCRTLDVIFAGRADGPPFPIVSFGRTGVAIYSPCEWGHAERARVRGVSEDRSVVGIFASVSQWDHVGCCDETGHFHATGHPIIEGYDPPEGWGWCYDDETLIDLPDQTAQLGPILRCVR